MHRRHQDNSVLEFIWSCKNSLVRSIHKACGASLSECFGLDVNLPNYCEYAILYLKIIHKLWLQKLVLAVVIQGPVSQTAHSAMFM